MMGSEAAHNQSCSLDIYNAAQSHGSRERFFTQSFDVHEAN